MGARVKFEKRTIPEAKGGGMFLKFKDGESRVGVFKGELYEFFMLWENGKSRVVSDDTPGAKSRFRLNFISKVDGEMRAQVFEFGLVVYNQLAEIDSDYDGLENVAVKITRRGTGADTTYIIMPAKEQPNVNQKKIIESVELLELPHKEKVPSHSNLKEYAPSDDEVPF